jgi:hypothetical protein
MDELGRVYSYGFRRRNVAIATEISASEGSGQWNVEGGWRINRRVHAPRCDRSIRVRRLAPRFGLLDRASTPATVWWLSANSRHSRCQTYCSEAADSRVNRLP